MEPKSIVLLSILFSLFLYGSSSLQFQTLTLTPLPEQQHHTTLEGLQQDSEPEPEPEPNTLTLDLHHVDSLTTQTEEYKNSTATFDLRLRRDAARVAALTAAAARTSGFSGSVVSGLAQGSGEYFTRIGLGTPARFAYMVLDTGSDVVWVQCSPCTKCYRQSDPVFDPRKSSSFLRVPCGSPLCRSLDSSGCNNGRKCLYKVSYGDGSFTLGEFSTETLTFRRTPVKNIALGCGHDNEGLFVGAAGLLGLGRGRLSFPTQAGRRFKSTFSYCLVDRFSASSSSKPSSIVFGDPSVSRRAAFTPLLTNPKLATFYYVGLEGISVGGARVRGVAADLFRVDGNGDGGVIVDSGTSVTRLARPAYAALRDAFRAGAAGLRPASGFSLFDTCYDLSGKSEVRVPTVVLHFAGADVSLPASNYVIPVDGSGKYCFAFAGTMSRLSIIGNIQQQGFRVVFDLGGKRVGFDPQGC